MARLKSYYAKRNKLYSEVLLVQEERCGICGNPPVAPGGLNIDHDHETGMVRGLLCVTCNWGLGNLGDTEDGLVRALAYVRRSHGSKLAYYQNPREVPRVLASSREVNHPQADAPPPNNRG